jgi:hypothetical protein
MFDNLITRLATLLLKNDRAARGIRRAQILNEMAILNGYIAANQAAIDEAEAANHNYDLGRERVQKDQRKLDDLFHEYVCL